MNILEKKLFHPKYLTTREESEFRLKCDVGDLMYFWINHRQPSQKKVGVGQVIKRARWNFDQVPEYVDNKRKHTFIFKELTWNQFLIMEGFDDFDNFDDNFFAFRTFFEDRNTSDFITYWFKEYLENLKCKFRILPQRDCSLTPNQVNCMFNQVNEIECPSFKVDCEICKKEVNEFMNPYDDLIICQECFDKRTKYYSKKYKKEKLTLRDFKKIFGFLRKEGKNEKKFVLKKLDNFIR